MIRTLAGLAVFGLAMWAQAPVLNGRFILAGEGAGSATLSILTFDSAGGVAGTEYRQAPGVTQSLPVTGTYAIAADGGGTLTLNTQVNTEDGVSPTVDAVYDFLSAKASGFVAIRRDSTAAMIVDVIPASAATSFSGAFILADEGDSSSGQKVAEIGALNLKGDGSLSGRILQKRNNLRQEKIVEGSYITDGSGFGTLKISSPMTADEDGAIIRQTANYVFLVTAKKQLIALRTDNSQLGLARMEPAQ